MAYPFGHRFLRYLRGVTMNLLPFDIGEVNAITRLAQVDKYMRRNCEIVSRLYDVPNLGGHSIDASKIYIDKGLPKWQWIGQQVGVSRFVILREKYASSLIDALRELEGRELSELLLRMRMVNIVHQQPARDHARAENDDRGENDLPVVHGIEELSG